MWQLRCIATWGRPICRAPVVLRFHTKVQVGQYQYPLLSYNVLSLIRYETLWPWSVTRSPLLAVICGQTLYQIWATSNNLRRSYCDFQFDLMTLNIVTCCATFWDKLFSQSLNSVNICSKSTGHVHIRSKSIRNHERNRTIPDWVIDLATFFKGADFQTLLFRGVYQTAPNLERTEFHLCTKRDALVSMR